MNINYGLQLGAHHSPINSFIFTSSQPLKLSSDTVGKLWLPWEACGQRGLWVIGVELKWTPLRFQR